MNLIRATLLFLILPLLPASAAPDMRSVSYDFTTKRASPTNFFGSNVLGGFGVTVHLNTNGTITLSNAFSGALSNLSYTIGASATNYTDARAVALSNLSYAIGTAGTNYTLATSNLLNSGILSKQHGSFTLSNLLAMGITNIVSADGNIVITTNAGVLTLQGISGGAGVNGLANSNLSYAIGTAATNYTDSRAVALSNLSYAIGTAATNYSLAASNGARLAAGLAATNHAAAILQAATNYADSVGGGGSSVVRSNANQFGATANGMLSISDGAAVTNLNNFGILTGGSYVYGGQFYADTTISLFGLTGNRPLFLTSDGIVTNASGTPDGTKFLRDDGVMAVPSGGGSQTPYTAHHNAAGYSVSNLSAIALGAAVQGTEPIRIGTNANRSVDPLILMARTVASQPGVAATNSHALSDSTVHTRTNAGYAANSVDIRVRFTNNFSMDHFVGLQFMPDLADGTMSNLYGAYMLPNVRSGTTRTNYGAYIGLANSGTVPANYGIRIATPTGNAPTIDYGVMVEARHASSSSFLDFWAAHDAGRYVIGANRDVIISRDRAYTAQLWVDAASGAAVDTELHGADAFGTDFAGGHLTLSAGRNTGAGAPGALIFSTSPYGSTGTASNNVVERMRIATNAVIIPSTAGLRMLGNNIASNRVWTATNATTGEGEWRTVSGGSGTPGGSSGAVQFNQSGAFDGTNDFTYDRTNGNLTVPNVVRSTFGQFHTPNTSIILSADDTLFVLSDVFKSIYSTDPTVSLGGNDLPFASVASHFAYSSTNQVTNCLAVGSETGGKLIVNFTNNASSTSNSAVVISNALAHVPSNTVHTASLAIVGAAVTTGVSNTVHPSWTLNNLPDAGGMEGAFQTIWRTNNENGVIVSTLAMGGLSVRPDTDTTHTFGRVRLGSPASDIMYVSHFDRLGTGDYAVRQTAAGATAINATAGQSITFSLQNSSIGAFSSAGNFGVGINVAQALVHLTNSVAGTNVLRVTQRGALANDIANFEHGTSNSFSFKTNGFVHLTATVFAPMTAVAGPSWVTNGMSAIWNSNGIATYIRSSTVGSATNLDTVLKVH